MLDAHSNENIPVQHFFCDSAMTSGTLSPDGKYFAAMVPASGAKCAIEEDDDPQAARVLLVIDLKQIHQQFLVEQKVNQDLQVLHWISNDKNCFL